MEKKFTDVYRLARKASSTMSGCRGGTYYDRLTGENPHGCMQYGPMGPEELLNEDLGDGSIVRVTIEILHAEPLSEKCINPFGDHRKHLLRRDLMPAEGR